MNKSFRATGNKIFVEMDQEEVSGHEVGRDVLEQGGISVPTHEWRKVPKGTVVAVGPGIVVNGENIKPGCEVGERVLLSRVEADTIHIEGKEYRVVDGREVLAIIEKE